MDRFPGKLILLVLLVLFLIGGVLAIIVRSEESGASKTVPAVTQLPKDSQKDKDDKAAPEKEPLPEKEMPGTIAVAPPPFTRGIFPCMGCHEDLKPNTTQRKLTIRHKDIILQHDEKNRWCLDCHTSGDMNHLHLASGKLIEFTESYKLCGQCHGPTLRAWEAGEHGKRTGSWDGEKQYLLCANCHNPHSPHFKPLKPLPPPVRPENLR
ncbi:MAG TPA: hypothetical protein VKX17_13520 [Planctomycetota bacterium]|nr:hypothetical protein [Planctomycetota bacterium]